MMNTKLLETDQHDAPSLEDRQNQKRQIALALKFVAVVFLLWIPLNLIQNLLSERCERQCEAVADILILLGRGSESGGAGSYDPCRTGAVRRINRHSLPCAVTCRNVRSNHTLRDQRPATSIRIRRV